MVDTLSCQVYSF